MATKKLKEEHEDMKQFYSDLKQTVKEAEATEGGLILYSQGIDILNEVDSLIEMYAQVEKKLEDVEAEKQKLK